MENLDKPIAIDEIVRKIEIWCWKGIKVKWLHNWILSNFLDTDNCNVIQILPTQSVIQDRHSITGSLLEMEKLRSPSRPTKSDPEFSPAP